MPVMDFPSNPTIGQQYVNEYGILYSWNGVAWIIGPFTPAPQTLKTVADILKQVRVLLQDTDVSAGTYRYTTDSLIMNLNQCMMDMFRIRPDLFLAMGYVVPSFDVSNLAQTVDIEPQYIPPVIYYVVGLTQARDDEQNQDARASGFLKVFQSALVSGGLAPA